MHKQTIINSLNIPFNWVSFFFLLKHIENQPNAMTTDRVFATKSKSATTANNSTKYNPYFRSTLPHKQCLHFNQSIPPILTQWNINFRCSFSLQWQLPLRLRLCCVEMPPFYLHSERFFVQRHCWRSHNFRDNPNREMIKWKELEEAEKKRRKKRKEKINI